MSRNRHLKLWVTAVTVILALVAGCSPAATPTPTAQPEVAATATPVPVGETPTPSEAGAETPGITENVGVYAVPGDMPSLDPPYMLGYDTNIGFNVYETLTLWDPDQGVVPALATSWESNEDGTEWTFHLRDDVTFHNGAPMTAEDVKVSLDRNIEVGMVAYDFIGIDAIEVVDDTTVRFLCSDPRDMPLILTASYGMFIYDAEDAARGTEWFALGNDAGSGPYMIETYESGQQIILTRYEDYWGGWEDGQFTKVIYQIAEDASVREQMIRSGQANFTYDLAFDSLSGLENVDGLTIVSYTPLSHLVAGFALHNPPVDNLQVRQALAYSFPYDAVIDGVFLGLAKRAVGFGPNSLWNPPADFPLYEHDLDQARTLLYEAGMGDGFELKLAMTTGSPELLDTVTLWQAELAKIDVQLDIEQFSVGPFWDYAYNPEQTDFQILLVSAGGDVPSPYSWLICYTSSPYGWMPFIGYSNTEFDKLVFDAWATEATDVQLAEDLWVQAQRILYDDAASVFILDYPTAMIHSSDIEGFRPNPPYTDIIFWYDLRRK